MSESKPDSVKRHRSDATPSERLRGAPRTDYAIPIPVASEDVLGGISEPSDDTPTIISKSTPKAPPALDDGIRGRRLAHFELLEQIGVGGMAAVLRARDSQLDRIVALKILPPDMAIDAENVQRFHQEARSAAKLDHENIARVFFCGEDQRLHFIAFEYVEGENLRIILERRGRLPVAEALPYVLQIAAGLAHAADRGVVHRDIKPSNIIITPAGRAKLVDMGLARSLGPQKNADLTHSGVTLGTFDYISPEQALEPRDADVRSDIYSLGCTFYHMMTGRAPVPEGTAAKKLHHHQHIPPHDPRELVPGLPDEVALILDRMMAKNPHVRYQTAGELVQHLLTAAKHLRVGADVPEGVLFVETPLPRLGGSRPYLLVGLAVAAVVALLLALDQPAAAPRAPSKRNYGPDEATPTTRKDSPKERLVPKVDDPKPIMPIPSEVVEAPRIFDEEDSAPDKLAEKLIEWLRNNRNARNLEIRLANNVRLEVGSKPFTGLVVNADQVTIKPKFADKRPTLQLIYAGGAVQTPSVALTVQANHATITGVRFLVDDRLSPAPSATLIGLQIEGGDRHQVSNCEFVQANASEENRLTSLVAVANDKQATLELTENAFLGYKKLVDREPVVIGGQNAISRQGSVAIEVANCVFGPHATMFRLEGKNQPLSLEHCSFMLGARSTAFLLLPDSQAKLTAEHCLFARFQEAPTVEDETTLIRLSKAADLIDFSTSRDNRFYDLTTYLALPDGNNKTTLAEFNRSLGVTTADTTSVLDFVPWRDETSLVRPAEPWRDGIALVRPAEALRAFLPYRDMEELRQSDGHAERLVGVEKLEGKSLIEGLPVAEKRSDPLTSKKRYVVPGKDDSKRGFYPTLDAALRAAKPGDTVLIRHDGELSEGTIRLENPNVELTIKPAPGYRPVLTLQATREQDASLFRLMSGKVQFEGLEIVLHPPENFRSRSVLTLLGDGQVAFKDCVVTLDQAENGTTPLAVVLLLDPRASMKMEPLTPRVEGPKPHLSFTNCFVRGNGDLVWNQAGRPLDLETTRSLIAVSGSLCEVELAANTVVAEQRSMLKLERTTTFLGGQLLRVQGKDVKDLTKMPVHQIVANECLFQPAQNNVPFIRFETQDSEFDGVEEKLKGVFLWEGKSNAFGVFDPFLTHWEIGATEHKFDLAAWKKYSGDSEPSSKFRVPLADPSTRETSFRELKPGQLPALRAGENLEFGAEESALQKLLPAATPR